MKGISSSRISHFIGKTGILCNVGEKALLFTSLSSMGGATVPGFSSRNSSNAKHIPAVYGLVNYGAIEKCRYIINTEHNKVSGKLF